MPAKKKAVAKSQNKIAVDDALFGRVATILEQSRANVVRAVNHHMVLAYWLIGREIVQEIQGGGERAGYGKEVIDGLSSRLAVRYGRGFSTTNLRYFRTFYQMFAERVPTIADQLDDPSPIFQEPIGKLGIPAIRHKPCGEFKTASIRHEPCDVEIHTLPPDRGRTPARNFARAPTHRSCQVLKLTPTTAEGIHTLHNGSPRRLRQLAL